MAPKTEVTICRRFSQTYVLSTDISSVAQQCGYPAEVGALFTTVPVLGLVGLGLPLLLWLWLGLVGLALWLVSGIALNKYRCE